jgi:hypothetical protein
MFGLVAKSHRWLAEVGMTESHPLASAPRRSPLAVPASRDLVVSGSQPIKASLDEEL